MVLIECALSEFQVEVKGCILELRRCFIIGEETSRLRFCFGVSILKEIVGIHDYKNYNILR